MPRARDCLVLTLCALPASAHTWIVDDDGPADFSTIQAAIDAAAPKDVVLVLTGTYPGFTLDTAVTVLGLPGVVVTGPALVQGVHDGQLAVLSNMQLVDVDVHASTSTVVLDEIATGTFGAQITIVDSTDVRLRHVHGVNQFYGPYLRVDRSRVEVAESDLLGAEGKDCLFNCSINPTCVPTDGAQGLRSAGPDAVLHAYRTDVRGGLGGYMCMICCDGKGGTGLAALLGSEVLIAGQAEHGLSPGCSPSCGKAVSAADNSVVRISGVTLGGAVETFSGASVQFPPLADPTLHILAQVGPGENVTFRASAPLGSSAQLLMGRFPALVPVPGALEDVLVQVIRVFELGPVGPNGVAGFNFVLPAFATSGSTLMAQARVTMPDGTTRFSNSVAVIVR